MANNDFAEQSGRDALTGWRCHCLRSPDSAGKLVFRAVGHVTMTKDKQKETERPRSDTGCCISILSQFRAFSVLQGFFHRSSHSDLFFSPCRGRPLLFFALGLLVSPSTVDSSPLLVEFGTEKQRRKSPLQNKQVTHAYSQLLSQQLEQ
jgi:hypothetical protein